MILKIAIADSNEEYVSRILSVLEEYEDLNLSVFTDENTLEQALMSQKFDVLLFDASVYDGHADGGKRFLPILLLDETQGVAAQFQKTKKIRKYQRISKIYQQILEVYAEVCGDTGVVAGQKKTSVIAVYSPVGGAGKTTTALCAATKYAVQGLRCLYLGLEDIGSEECYLPRTDVRGVSEIAACLGENMNFTMKIQSLLQTGQNNLFYLNHFDSPNDVYELSAEDLKELLEVFRKSGLFDVIVADMSCSMDVKAQVVFELADRIIIVEKPDRMAASKMTGFLNQMHIINAYSKKMVRLLNFYMGRESTVSSDIPVIGRINAAQNPEPGQFIAAAAQDACSNCLLQLI